MVPTVIIVHIVNVYEHHITAGITTVENSGCKRELNFSADLKKLHEVPSNALFSLCVCINVPELVCSSLTSH